MLEPGTVIAGYRLDRVLGAGGMGVVYEATQLSLERTVALKVLAPEYGNDETFRRRFRREGRIQAALDHPNIVTVHEAGETERGLFLAMRLVRGPTLKDMIVSRELDAGRALRLLRPVADALDSAHDAGLIHRDVKPQNILVGGRDHPYLADFGLTQATDGSHVTATGQFVGTFDYISPEQIQGHDPTAAVDIYAYAAVLYQCLTGQVPFAHRSHAAVLYAHMAQPPPRVTDQRPELPAALDDVVARGMAKDPAERQPSASALIEEAERAFDRRSRAVLRPPGPIESPEEIGVREHERSVSTAEAARPGMEHHAVTQRMAPSEPMAVATPTVPAGAPLRVGRAAWAGVAAGVLAALAAGILVAGSGDDEPTADAPNSASLGPIEVRYGAGLERADGGPRIPGLASDAVRLRASGGAGVAVGLTDATGTRLLPAALQKRLAGALPEPEVVRAGEASAYRYDDLRVRGIGQPLTVYTAPTTSGVAMLACHGPATFATRCGDVAESLELHGTKALPLGPSADYATALGKILRTLGTRRAELRKALAAARKPADQAKAAEGLAGEYAKARREIDELEVSPVIAPAHAAIVAAVGRTSEAYSALAEAARRGDRRGYARARGRVARSEARVAGALKRLTAAGYRVG